MPQLPKFERTQGIAARFGPVRGARGGLLTAPGRALAAGAAQLGAALTQFAVVGNFAFGRGFLVRLYSRFHAAKETTQGLAVSGYARILKRATSVTENAKR